MEINSLCDKHLTKAAKTSEHAERQEDTWGQMHSWGEKQHRLHSALGHTPSEYWHPQTPCQPPDIHNTYSLSHAQ